MKWHLIKKAKDLISNLVALGVPAIVLIVAVETAGVAGGAAMVVGLSSIGGPLGLIGGVALLGVLVLISKKAAEIGYDEIIKRVLKGIKDSGKTKEQIFSEIGSYPIPESLKKSIRAWVEELWED
jgi:hypothetical protein